MKKGSGKSDWRRALFLADIGLIIAIFIVIYALTKGVVGPREPAPTPSESVGEILQTVVRADVL